MGLIKEISYCLSDFSGEEKQIAKDFIIAAIKGNIEMSADKIVGDVFDQLETVHFKGEDTITINFNIETNGNDIITAIGAARRQLNKSQPK
jgi:hypothetical protein